MKHINNYNTFKMNENLDITSEDMEFINNYHKEAKKISKYDVSPVSDVQTEIGMQKGFTYGNHIIFFFDETMLVESPGIGIHELAIYEIEGL